MSTMNDWKATVRRDLHDLAQPVTALQCRLEIAQMVGDEASMREAVEGGLEDTRRIFAAMEEMRARLMEEAAPVGGTPWQ
jgi:glucose-6-phosphate-specific signal transduction histidine kinase